MAVAQRPRRENKRLKASLSLQQALCHDATKRIEASKILLTSSEGYIDAQDDVESCDITQREVLQAAGLSASKKAFDFDLCYGPYRVDFSRNGRYLLVGGKLGTIALVDCHSMTPLTELNVEETVRDVKVLQDHTMFAVAQKKYLYMYDNQGVELHCLRDTVLAYRMEYLPYHFLLVTIGEFGILSYQDISTGQVVAKHRTKRGPCQTIAQNRSNAVIHLGHTRGTVTLWTPNVEKPVVDMLCHRGPVTALDVDGNYMVTAGIDGCWRIWDIRRYDCVSSYRSFGHPASTVRISQTGVVGVGFGSHVQMWNDVLSRDWEGTDSTTVTYSPQQDREKPRRPYLVHDYPGQHVSSLAFRPYEDVCVVGHDGGISSLIIPGAGRANLDSFEADPFENTKKRGERKIRSLLEKLQPDMITLDPSVIGRVAETQQEPEALPSDEEVSKKPKKEKIKQRGRSKADHKQKKRNLEVAAQQRDKAKKRVLKTEAESQGNQPLDNPPSIERQSCLSRFKKKS